MEDINFNQIKRLWNLKLVVDSGSIKRAAIRANVTSSAMSQSVSGLEEALGRKLLLRKKDQLLPTEFGAQLLRSAQPAFEVCFGLQKDLSGGCKIPKLAWLDFATTDSLAHELLPDIIGRLRSQFPQIRLKVKSGRSSELTKLVQKSELCMAVVEDNDFISGVSKISLAEDRLGFFVAAKVAASYRYQEAIARFGVGVLSPGGDGHPSYFTKFIKGLGKGFKPTLTSESYEILRTAAVRGVIVAALPTRVAMRTPGELVEIFPSANSKQLGKYTIYLVSEPGCAPEENVFLAQELKSLLVGR